MSEKTVRKLTRFEINVDDYPSISKTVAKHLGPSGYIFHHSTDTITLSVFDDGDPIYDHVIALLLLQFKMKSSAMFFSLNN